ncbi:MAG: RNA polymerase sigma factor [Spongiibacteraceae bacterium]
MNSKPKNKNIKEDNLGIFQTYLNHILPLKRFVTRLLSNPKDVEDVLQETFLRAYAAEKKKNIQQPKSYLFRVSRNVVLSHLREKTRKPTDYLEDFQDSSVIMTSCSTEDEASALQIVGIHCEAVASLAPKCRKIYLMRKAYGMSYKDIARALNITVSTVETHLERGLAQCDAYILHRNKEHTTPCRTAKKVAE